MDTNASDLKDIEVLEKHCGWLIVPRGMADANSYKFAARLMFKHEDTIPDKDSKVLARVFDNWPGFLCRTQWQPKIYLASESTSVGKPEVTTSLHLTVMPATLGATFRATLGLKGQQSARLDQVCDIWRAAFPDAGNCEKVVVKRKADFQETLPHARAARALNNAWGGLNVLSLASSLDSRAELLTHAGTEAMNFAAALNAPYSGAAQTLANRLDDFGAKLGSPADRGMDMELTPNYVRITSQQVVESWKNLVLGKNSPWKSAEPKTSRPVRTTDGSLDDVENVIAYTMPDTKKTREALGNKMLTDSSGVRRAAEHDILRIARDVRKIAHHGWLLRYLGLVVEFTAPVAGWTEVIQAVEGYVPGAVVTDNVSGYPVAGADEFDRPGFPQMAGVLTLNEPLKKPLNERRSVAEQRFELMQLDVQSAARKLVQTSMTHNAQRDSVAAPSEKIYETAVLRSGGLTLVDRNTEKRTAEKRAADETIKCVQGVKILHAEDITLGIRPDVQTLQIRENAAPAQSPWRSLTGWRIRSAHLEVGPFDGQRDITGHLQGVDAGEALLGASHRLVASPEYPHNLGAITSEEVFTWDGWSMAVGHPDPGVPNERPAYSKLKVGSLVVTLEARGDLPTLRVGHGYLVGARAVYVDGGGASLREAESRYGCEDNRPVVGLPGVSGGAAFFPFMRYEPIAPPDIHLGECIDYAHFPQVSTKKAVLATSAKGASVRKNEARYFVPPAVSLEQAIAHGMYDSKERRAQPPQSAFSGICLTPEGRFPNVANGVVPKDAVVPRTSSAGDVGDTIFHASSFARRPIIPYLPDPWARRLVIGAFRASDGELLAWERHDYYGAGGLEKTWPNAQPLRLEIHRAQDRYLSLPQTYGSATGRVDFKLEGATLHLTVPAGEDLRIHAWHEIDERILGRSAIVDQMADHLITPEAQGICSYLGITANVNDKETIRENLIGCLSRWHELRHNRIRSQISRERTKDLTNITSFGMINPSEVLTVVHAVDHPPAPRFLWSGLASSEVLPNVEERRILNLPAGRLRSFEQSVRLLREPGRTDATLAGDLEIDRPTTARVDFTFTWTDQEDDLTESEPTLRPKNAIVSLDQIPPVLKRALDPTRQMPNTRATPDQADDNSLILLYGVRTALKRESNEDLRSKKLSVAFGDTRARIVDITAVAQSRFADEFKARSTPFFSQPGEMRQLVCPSSASPAIPSIDYVMPQYQWLENKDGHQSHERVGGCFRVWLNRPWFSSGVEERLAVVCWPPEMFNKSFLKKKLYSAFAEICGDNNDPPPFLESFVTRWGLDPLWAMEGGACVGSVPPEAFRGHICDRENIVQQSKAENCFPVLDLRECEAMKSFLTSYEEASAKVALVLYEPKYDKASHRHYVDIQMDERYSYFPFVRLALARYQKYALPGFELSEITAHEFVQLPPTRRTRIKVLETNQKEGKVSLALTMQGALPAVQVGATDWKLRVTARLEYLPVEAWKALKASVTGNLGMHGVAWVPDTQVVDLQRAEKNGLWECLSPFTLDRKRIYSILIEEFEVGFQDDRDATPDAENTKNFGTPVKTLYRRVFSDRLLLPERL